MRNYKDLLVWEKPTSLPWRFTGRRMHFLKKSVVGLTSQVRRASSSIAAILAERCGRRSDGEMARFVQIAMGSGADSYHLILCRDLGILETAEFSSLTLDLEEVMRMLSALSGRVRSTARSSVLELKAKG